MQFFDPAQNGIILESRLYRIEPFLGPPNFGGFVFVVLVALLLWGRCLFISLRHQVAVVAPNSCGGSCRCYRCGGSCRCICLVEQLLSFGRTVPQGESTFETIVVAPFVGMYLEEGGVGRGIVPLEEYSSVSGGGEESRGRTGYSEKHEGFETTDFHQN